jgi:hypothetical protein
MTLNAVEAIIPTGNFGPVGLAVTATASTRWCPAPKATATRTAAA